MSFTDTSLETLRQEVARFASDREWERFHTVRNLLLAVMSEVGEAADIVRWSGDSDPAVPLGKEQDWAHELADIQILLIRLADRSGVDLSRAVQEKLQIAAKKYPVEGFKGSCRKYDEAQ